MNPLASKLLIYYPQYKDGSESESSPQLLYLTLYDQHNTEILKINSIKQHSEPFFNTIIFTFSFSPGQYISTNLTVIISLNKKVLYKDQILFLPNKTSYIFFQGDISKLYSLFSILSSWIFEDYTVNDKDFFPKLNTLMMYIPYNNPIEDVIKNYEKVNSVLNTLLTNYVTNDKMCSGYDYYVLSSLIIFGVLFQESRLNAIGQNEINLLMSSVNLTENYSKFVFSIKSDILKRIRHYKLNYLYQYLGRSLLSLMTIELFLGKVKSLRMFLTDKGKFFSYKLLNDFTSINFLVQEINRRKIKLISSDEYKEFQQIIINFIHHNKKVVQDKLFFYFQALIIAGNCKEDLFSFLKSLKGIYFPSFSFYDMVKKGFQGKQWKNVNNEIFTSYILSNLDILQFCPDFFFEIDNDFAFFITTIKLIPSQYLNYNLIGKSAVNKKIKSIKDIELFVMLSSSLNPNFFSMLKNIFAQKITTCLLNITFPISDELRSTMIIIFSSGGVTFFNYKEVLNAYLLSHNLTFSDLGIIFNCIFYNNITYLAYNEIKGSIIATLRLILMIYPRNQEMFLETFGSIYPKIITVNQTSNYLTEKNLKDFWSKMFNIIPHHIYIGKLSEEVSQKDQVEMAFNSQIIEYLEHIKIQNLEHANGILIQMLGENKIKCNNKNLEYVLSYFIKNKVSTISIEENFKSVIIDHPSESDFWYLYITAEGKFTSFINEKYLEEIRVKVRKLYIELTNADITYEMAKKIYEYDERHLSIFMKYLAFSTRIDEKSIIETINNIKAEFKDKDDKLVVVLNIADKFSNFFKEKTKIYFTEISNYYFKSNLQKEKIKNVCVSDEISNLHQNFEQIGLWEDSILFISVINKELSKEKAIKEGGYDLETFSSFMQNVIRKCHKYLDMLVNNSQMKFKFKSKLLEHYITLNDVQKEIDIVTVALLYEKKDDKKILSKIFKSETNKEQLHSSISQFLNSIYSYNAYYPLCEQMLQLNSNIKLTESKLNLYQQFMIYKKAEKKSQIEYIEFYKYITEVKGILNNGESSLLYMIDFLKVFNENFKLIEFLYEVSEDEILPMNDLIDDQSDNVINVKILMNLNELKYFLVKNIHIENTTERDFIANIENLLPSIDETKQMISLCGELFPLIEELHNELINKEEASKLKIKEIVKKSDVIIKKDTISIQCGRKRKIFYKDIVELKDRCLLFVSNTEDNSIDPLNQSMINSNINYASVLVNPNINNNRKSVINTCRTFQPKKSLTANEIFIKISSIIINIDKSLKELLKNGYPNDLNETIKIRNSDYSSLSDYDTKLSTMNKEWNTDIINAYENYYALTLYYGNQLWEIVDYVSGGLIRNQLKKGEYLLQRLGRQSERRQQVQLSMLASAEKKKVDISSNTLTPKERLNLLGDALMNFINEDNTSIYRRESKILKKIPIDLKKNVITFNSNITKEETKNDIDINMSVMDNMITHKSIIDINLNMSSNENGQIQNLLFTSVDESKSNLYQYLCSIYLTYERRLPLGSQLLICDSSISPHHLISFLLRCFLLNDPNILFTIARVEKLSFNLQRELLHFINDTKYKTNWSLCVISGEEYSYLSSQIRNKDNVYIIKNVEILEENTLVNILKENDMINATIVTSIFTGDGKTYYIENSDSDLDMSTLAIQDEIDIDDIVDNLFKLNENKKRKIHINIRGLIKRYDILDYILFNYIFCNEFMKTNDSRICINNKESNVIYLEIANDIDITQSKVLSLLPYKKDISFSLLNFAYPKITEANYVNNSYLNLQYFLNYIHYYNTEEIDEKDIKKDNENWIENFSIEDCRKMLNDFVIKYQNNKRLSYRQLWMYINFVGSQLIDFSNNYNFTVDVLKAKDMLTMRSFIFESLIISCEEFSMNKDIISWNTMVNKYVLLINESSPLNAVYKDIDILPSLLVTYLDEYRKEEMSNDFNAKNHSELRKILCDYTEKKKENNDAKIKEQNIITDFFSKGEDINDNINGGKYILTSDNFLKMILIIQRVRARVPIILIGETGCGKTTLIRYLTEKILKEEFNIIDLHAGTTKAEIISRINDIIDKHKTTNSNSDIEGNRIWIFLDEINTCNHLGFLSEIITEHKMNGIPLPNNIYFIGASNPYKIRKPQTGNVNKVGLQIVNSSMSNSISSSTVELVYKVNKFPMSINDFIWDYGTLSNDQSFMYICSILSDLPLVNLEFTQLNNTVFQSHKFIEDNETDYMVSLRDIARFKYIYNWFFHYDNNNKKDTMKSMKSLILTLFICYYIKISSMKMRELYLQLISGLLLLEYDEIKKYLKEYMNEFINTLDINSMYARNTALIENLFCLYVCIMNKIPLFICGKPGNSKTLSVNILISNFKGRESKNINLRHYPKLIPIYYQGSQASTSEGISKVVHNAKNILANDNNNNSLPIIVFDEIGLAENAPSNPLKVLHSLFDYEINGKMCFVGISNWSMDASKMNRVIYLARPDPDISDLILTGKTIYSSITSSSLSKNILSDNNDIIRFLSLAYSEFLSSLRGTPQENFYGIRDYYALIKQTLINKNKDDNNPFNILSDMIKKAFCRNFGGVKDMSKNIMRIYNEVVRKNIFNADNETLIIKKDTYNIVDMILDNIKDISSMNRYLLLFSSKFTQGNIIHLLNHFLAKTKSSYKIMISSKFTDDISSDDYIFHKLSEIILSMEKGTCIILKDFDYLYGALYDLFNQNFTVIGNRKNCRIALGGTNNPMCYVNDAFKVIVLSNTTELPPPFLNRFEKQLVEYDLIITYFHEQIITEITQWMTNVLKLDNDVSKLCFVGYNDSTFITNIVISESETRTKDIIRLIKYIIINLANMNFSLGIDISSDEVAANNLDEIKSVINTYYDQQAHSSLNDFHFKFHKQVRKAIIYTYSNILDEIVINKNNVYTFSLSEIKSENDLISRLAISNNKILIIKVDYDKDYKHLDFVYLIVNDFASQYENVYIVIYMLSSSIITNIRPITITTMKGWIHCTIDNINGNVVDYQIARSLLSLSSIEIIDKYFDVNVFNEFLTKIILSLNYSITNDDDKYMISDHMMRIINNFKSGSNVNYFALLRKAIFQLMKRSAAKLVDWKEFVIEQRKKYPIHNLYKVIKDYISFAVMPHFKKIIYLIESNNSFLTFNTTAMLFTSIITNEINNVIKMRNVIPTDEIVHTESILFPFSVNNIRDIINAVSEDVTKIEIVETALLMSATNYTDDAKEIINTSMQKINDVLSYSCYLYKYQNVIQGNDAIVMNYSRDIITFYVVIRNRYKISKFPFMYRFIKNITDTMNITRNIAMLIVFLIKNEKKFKKIFSIIDLIDKENIVLKIIYDNISKDVCDVRKMSDIDRVMIEAKMFNDIFKFIVDYIISHLDAIDNKTYIEVIDVLNDDSGDDSHKELQLIYLVKQSQFEITQSENNIIEQICVIIKQKLTEKIEDRLINSMLDMMMIIVSLSSISQEKKNEIIASSANNATMLPHMSLLFYKYMLASKIINDNASMSTFEQIEECPILIALFNKINNNNEIKMFFIDHFGLYLLLPQSQDDIDNYINEHCDYVTKVISKSSSNEISFFNDILNISYIKHFFLLFSKQIVFSMNTSTKPNSKISTMLNSNNNSGIISNIKFYIIRSLLSLLNIHPSLLINMDIENQCDIKWINKGLLESDGNALMILPHLPSVDDEYSKCEKIMSKLIKESDNDANIKEIIEYINLASSNWKIKYCIYQYMISSIYLSFTGNNFMKSITYENCVKCFINSDNIKTALINTLTEDGYNYITDIINNFPSCKELSLSPSSIDIGIYIIINMMYSLMLSLKQTEHSFFSLYTDISNEFSSKYIPGNDNDPKDESRQNMIAFVKDNYAVLGIKHGIYECQCGYLYSIGNCTRPYATSDCPFCGEKIGAKSKHVVVDTSKCLINCENKKTVNKDEMIENMIKGLKKTKGYFVQDNIIPIRKMHDSMYVISLIVHSIFMFKKEKEDFKDKIYKDKKHTDDIDTYISKHVFAVYNKLKSISRNENIYTVIIQMIDVFIEMSTNVDFGDYDQRTNFEEKFDQVVSSMISSSVVESKKYINKYTITTTSTYLKIINNTATFEEIDSYDNSLSSHYEFFTSKPHVISKWFDICDICNTVESNSDKYKYIKILNSFSDQIQKLKYITTISSLSNKLINDNNYKMSRADAKTQSIETFISSSSTLTAMWKEFQIAWKEINSLSIQYKCKILPRLNEMTPDLAISFLLCDDKEPGYGMYIACAYQYLAQIQNEIIDEINEGDHSVTFPIQMMSSKQIFSFDEDNVKLYEKFFYVYDVNSKSYKVDYDTINSDIKAKLISSKIKKINYEELNVIQYKYELLSMTNQHSNFIDVINRDIPQEKISDANLLSQLSTELSMKNSYDINSIYTMLELLCCQLKYEKKDAIYPSRAISDYIIASNRSENYDTLLRWNIITKVKLSNIICLYEIVEERIFDLIIDLISPDYKQDISDKEKANEVFKEMFEQNSDTMIYPTLLNVIKAVKKFIVRCLMSDIETHFAIRDYLTRKDLWNEIDGTTETMTDNMYNDFPDSILISNTVKLYEMLNEMYKKTHVELNSLKVENKEINYI